MSSFLDIVSAGFGAPVNREAASLEGALTSAKTQGALMDARERRAKARQAERTDAEQEMFRANAGANGGTPSIVDMLTSGYGGNYDQLQSGEGQRQENDFRALLGNPETALPTQIAAQQGVKGEVAHKFYQPAPGLLSNIADPNQAPELTALGKADVNATNALANQRMRPPAAGGSGPVDPVKGKPINVGGVLRWSYTGEPVGGGAVYTDAAAELAAARAGGTAAGGKQAGLPASLNAIQNMRRVAQNLNQAPGRNTIYGGSALLNPISTNMGGDSANAETIRQQLASQGFLASIGQMKGMGALSNAEGLKVESALQRLTNTALPDDQFAAAYDELMESLTRLEQVAQQEASAVPGPLNPGNAPPPAAPGGGRAFNTEAEVEAAAAAQGWTGPMQITIGGRPATWSP